MVSHDPHSIPRSLLKRIRNGELIDAEQLSEKDAVHRESVIRAIEQHRSEEELKQDRADELYAATEEPNIDALRRVHPELAEQFARIEGERRLAGPAANALPSRVEGVSFFGEQTPPDASVDTSLRAGQSLGDYRLIRRVGQGGMGQVWEAEQTGLGRRVALKLLRPDRISPRSVALFAREARAGGRLNHPGIVGVHAYGEDGGLAWIAMEFVEGAWTLRDFIDCTLKLDRLPKTYYRDVARLTAEIAEALESAHAAGVIHRDLKPQNVLVTRDNRPKVTDFGLARITDESAISRAGEVAGTYYYMSPEQVRGRRLRLDQRSDIFSLGVVLYELLALRRPFDGDTAHQVAEQILRQEPPHLIRIRSRVPRSLAIIAEKCLSKPRHRRYRSMAELASDLRRYINKEAILARPPSALQRTLLWAQRNRTKSAVGAVAAGAFVAVSLLLIANMNANADLGTANEDLSRTVQERDDAITSLETANESLGLQGKELGSLNKALKMEQGKLQAAVTDLEQQTEVANEVADFQSYRISSLDPAAMGVGIRRSLVQAISAAAQSPGISEEEIAKTTADLENSLDRANFTDIAAELLNDHFIDGALDSVGNLSAKPLVQAQLFHSLAMTLNALDSPRKALHTMQRALAIRLQQLGANHPLTLASRHGEARLLERAGELGRAEELYRKLLEDHSKELGPDHEDTIALLGDLAFSLFTRGEFAEAEDLLKESLVRCERAHAGDAEITFEILDHAATLYLHEGRLDEAEIYARRILDTRSATYGEDSSHSIVDNFSLGMILFRMGRLAESETHLSHSLQVSQRLLGDDHAQTWEIMATMASLLVEMRKFEEATRLARDVHERQVNAMGREHPATLRSLWVLGRCLERDGKIEEAAGILETTVEVALRVLGPDHSDTLGALKNLGTVRISQGRLEEAGELFATVIDGHRGTSREDHSRTISAMSELAGIKSDQGMYEEAEDLLHEALELGTSANGERHPATSLTLHNLGHLFLAQGKLEGAEEYLRQAFEVGRQAFGYDNDQTRGSMMSLSTTLARRDKLQEALEIVKLVVENTPPEDPSYQRNLEQGERLRSLIADQARATPDLDR